MGRASQVALRIAILSNSKGRKEKRIGKIVVVVVVVVTAE
jgi:hypothetical protein